MVQPVQVVPNLPYLLLVQVGHLNLLHHGHPFLPENLRDQQVLELQVCLVVLAILFLLVHRSHLVALVVRYRGFQTLPFHLDRGR